MIFRRLFLHISLVLVNVSFREGTQSLSFARREIGKKIVRLTVASFNLDFILA